ncbi:MAG: aminotransferase class I/II-fold pyridoxal phosphate-dependent enzyme, partial [Acidobacteriota bacterium]
DDDREVVIPTPAWVSFEEQARLAGGTVVAVPMDASDGFRIHADRLIAAITDRTCLVLVNSPSNPTGGTITADDLRTLATACAERGVVLLADETYERFLYDGAEHASVAALARDLPDTVVLVGSFSKTWAMTGWRLGWAAGPAPVIGKLLAVQSHATSNPTTFAMVGALAALADAEDDVRRMLDAFTRRRAAALDALDAIPGVVCPRPAGAFYAFPDVSAAYGPGRAGSLELAESLLEEAGVATVPGIAFGNDRHLRLSFACDDASLLEGIRRIRSVLDS